MSTFIITQLLFILQPVFSMWNNYGPYGGGGGGGGYPQGPPNNNVAIGYPTAYSLYVGRGNNGGWGGGGGDGWGMPHSGGGRGFGSAIKCENGGAHIGQCRLDNDAICIALGGSCVNGACCTTPFSSLQSTHKPLTVIDGEVGEITANEGSILNEVSGESDEMLASTSGLIHTGITSSTPLPTTTMRSRRIKKVDQVSTKITLSPVGPEMEEFLSIVKKKEKRKKTTTTTTPLPVHLSILLSTCASGLRPVGPCQETSDCPTLHHCQNNQICCYNIFHP